MFTLYQMQTSGNCYKLRLAMAHLGIPFQVREVDILQGESRTDAFLQMNPNGKVPLLLTPEGEYLPESNAGLFYLAEGTKLFPEDRLVRARILQWLFFEQYSHEPYIAVARFWSVYVPGGREEKADMFPLWWEKGHQALAVMEQHLARQDWFAGRDFSIADISLYAYTHMAGDGGFELADYPHIRDWLTRVAALEKHVALEWSPSAAS